MGNRHRTGAQAVAALHLCPGCGSSLVQPTCWEQAGDRGHWRLWRRCPECEWQRDGIYGEREIDAYDEELDNGTEVLSKNLKELEHENMERMADSFATALADDLISAEDFT